MPHTATTGESAPAPRIARRWVLALVKASDGIDRVCTFLAVVATVLFAAIMLVAVFFRYVLNDSIAWSDEVALMVFTWGMLLFIASAYRHDKHVNLDILIDKMGPRAKGAAEVLAEGLTLGFLLSLTVSGIQALYFAGRMRSDALQWPLWIPYLAIPVACAILNLHWMRRNAEHGTGRDWVVKGAIGLLFFILVYLPIGQYIQVTGLLRAAVLIVALFGPC